jgi:predicted RND superfamily exporter protein
MNFGVILAGRYSEELRKGSVNSEAVHIAVTKSASATSTAALAAAFSYGSLMLTNFRGFRQFGIIGFTGMVLCWMSAFSILPAMLLSYQRFGRKGGSRDRKGDIVRRLVEGISKLIARRAKTVVVVSAIVTLGAAAVLPRVGKDIFEADLTKIRSLKSMKHGAGYYSKYVDEIFGRYLSPVVILAPDHEAAVEIANRIESERLRAGPQSLVASVHTIDDFIPKEQTAKIRVLREIKELLPARILKKMKPTDQRLAKELLSPQAFHHLEMRDLPKLVIDRFREQNGRIGNVVVVDPPLGQRIRERENLFRLVRELRATADAVAPGTPVAGTLPITADMLESVAKNGLRTAAFAFIVVVALIVVLFRNLKSTIQVMATLMIGVIWLAGIIVGFNLRINFLNFIALPLTFGLGVDYGVNILKRYEQMGRVSILDVVQSAGGPVGLCSITTMVGFGSLLFASNLAFFSFGELAVLGSLTCIVAALVTVPAVLRLAERS